MGSGDGFAYGSVVSDLLNIYLYTCRSVQLSDLLGEAFICRGQWLMTRLITGHSAAEYSALNESFLTTFHPSLQWSMTIMGWGRAELLKDGWGGVLWHTVFWTWHDHYTPELTACTRSVSITSGRGPWEPHPSTRSYWQLKQLGERSHWLQRNSSWLFVHVPVKNPHTKADPSGPN